MIGKFQQDFPNAIFFNDAILQNDNFRSWNWQITDSEHQLFIKGRDFVTLNGNGKIAILVGFSNNKTIQNETILFHSE